MSITVDTVNLEETMREGYNPLANTWKNMYPEERSDRGPQSDAIANFVISTPLTRGVKSHTERIRAGSVPFAYVSRIEAQSL